jgi:hypothetical protein
MLFSPTLLAASLYTVKGCSNSQPTFCWGPLPVFIGKAIEWIVIAAIISLRVIASKTQQSN